jgi:hypothetical protein
MDRRIQSRVSTFDDVEFPATLRIGTIILKVTRFASIIIIGFDPAIIKINDIVAKIIQAVFFNESISLVENLFICQWALMVHFTNIRN